MQDVTVLDVGRVALGPAAAAAPGLQEDLAEVNLVNLQRLAPRRRRYQVFPEKVSEAPLAVFEEE
ncbi:MAG TPA: hypothetical protein VFK84_11755 [Burkholderiales bacterium]|nr:hypothetical protein [Burkholderiales bacterium]